MFDTLEIVRPVYGKMRTFFHSLWRFPNFDICVVGKEKLWKMDLK